MRDSYVYPHTNILKNLANIQDEKELSYMEAEYTSLRLAELVTKESASCFDFSALCDMHHYIFRDIYEWAGKIRVINIEKSEPALGGISIEYSDCFDIEKDAKAVVDKMNNYPWDKVSIEESAVIFSKYLAELWKVHPYREGNTRTVITFCSQFRLLKWNVLQCWQFPSIEIFRLHNFYMGQIISAPKNGKFGICSYTGLQMLKNICCWHLSVDWLYRHSE